MSIEFSFSKEVMCANMVSCEVRCRTKTFFFKKNVVN